MRHVLLLFVAFLMCAYTGCGGGSGIKSPTKEQVSKANRPATLVAPDEGPARPRSQARPNASAESKETAAAAAPTEDAKSAETQPPAAQASTDEFDSPPAENATADSSEKKPAPRVANPRFADMDEDAPSANAANNSAAAKKPAPRVANPRFADMDEDAPARSAPAAAAGGAGGKGMARPGARTGGSGVAGGKGTPRNAPVDEEAAPVESGPVTEFAAATKFFEDRKEFDAVQHLYAHLLTDDSALSDYPLHWVEGINEPRTFLRWGVGVVYNAPDNYADRPPVIGEAIAAAAPAPTRGARSMRGGGESKVLASNNSSSSRQTTQVDRSTPHGNLIYYTGDFGERLINRLESRRLHREYFYGKLLADVKVVEREGASGRAAGRGTTVAEQSTTRRAVLDAGEDERVTQSVRGTRGAPAGAAAAAEVDVAASGTIVPGVVFLGAASESNAEKELLDRGQAAGVDAVLIFYVTVKSSGRSAPAISTTSLGVHILKNGDSAKTATLNNETVAKAREREKDSTDDPVEVALDKIFNQYADQKLKFTSMPELTPEQVKGRVETLVANKSANPLPGVVEIMSYHKLSLIDDAATVAALGTLLGSDDAAKKLLGGTRDEKLAAIDKWLPGKFQDPSAPSGQFR